jgi:hypothetical protein
LVSVCIYGVPQMPSKSGFWSARFERSGAGVIWASGADASAAASATRHRIAKAGGRNIFDVGIDSGVGLLTLPGLRDEEVHECSSRPQAWTLVRISLGVF